MIAFLAMIPAFALGWAVVALLMPRGRGFFGWLLEISLGIGMGAGISSVVDFVLTWAGIANRISLLGVELLALAGAGFFLMRRRGDARPEEAPKNPSWIWLLRIAAILAVILVALDFSNTTASNPTGEWDAAGIWNLRARYLTGGAATWRNAVSNQTSAGMVGASHPGYPLLVSGFIARTWTILGDSEDAVPAALSLTFTLATVGVLCGALAGVSESLGLLAILALLASETFVSQSASQYADIPMSFFALATIAMMAFAESRDWPPGLLALAGLFAGFTGWTKNEGLPFAVAAVMVALWRAKYAGRWMIAGAAAPVLATLSLKFFLAQGTESIFPKSIGKALKDVVEPSRWGKIIASFAHTLWGLGYPWAHPILLLAILGFVFGFLPRKTWPWWLFLSPLVLLAADFGIFLITTADLDWHLSTSNNRLILQVLPATLFGYFLMLRAPVGAEEEAVKPASKGKKKRARA